MTDSRQGGTAVQRTLSDGLVLRQATPADVEALVAFNSKIHSDEGPEHPDERVGAWTRDLMERPHPTFRVDSVTVVEEPSSGKIISSMNLISQTWRYAGIPFGVGRAELVGTLPEYRNRGLVRAQFEVIHAWSAERSEKVQAITGIPYYYRLFGYEMALNLGGGRLGYSPHVPRLKEGEEEPYRIRPAETDDLGFILEVYEQATDRNQVSCVWDQTLLRYELNSKDPENINRLELRIVESLQREPLGFLAHPFFNWGPTLAVTIYELKPGVSWAAVTPVVVRYLEKSGQAQAREEPWGAFAFWLGERHPVYEVISDRLPRVRKPYAWYLRVPDLPGYLSHIAPALEVRLARSPLVGYTGELKITFYNRGIRLVFEAGRLATVNPWDPEPMGYSGEAAFPGLTFLQLVFGYRSLEELKYAFPDCITRGDDAQALLDVLFPRQPSEVWAVS